VGFSGIVAEVVLFREFLIVFSGNELSMGIVIGNWLLLQAAGSYFPLSSGGNFYHPNA